MRAERCGRSRWHCRSCSGWRASGKSSAESVFRTLGATATTALVFGFIAVGAAIIGVVWLFLTTGAGKSTVIRELMTGARALGNRAVIADPNGGYARLFYKPERGDVSDGISLVEQADYGRRISRARGSSLILNVVISSSSRNPECSSTIRFKPLDTDSIEATRDS